MIEKVISGGQVGADIAGLRAAYDLGIATGGYAPRYFRTKHGSNPELGSKYGLMPLDSDSYPLRTKVNVIASDCTIQFAHNWKSPGELATTREIKKAGKPYLQVGILLDQDTGYVAAMQPHPDQCIEWLLSNPHSVVNIAGNANPAIEGSVEYYLTYIFKKVNGL